MRQYVLTRAAYGPEWTLEANARRLTLTRAVTARLMAAQTNRDWTWVILVDPRDPLLDERIAVFAEAAPRLHVIRWTGSGSRSEVAFAAYRAPWSEAIGPRDDRILQTRLDDDDGLAPSALATYRARAERVRPPAILMLPRGVRVWDGRYTLAVHNRNAMHALVTGPGQTLGVYDYGHATCHRAAPIYRASVSLSWLWVRHRETLSGWRTADRPIDDGVRRLFPIDWTALSEAWA